MEHVLDLSAIACVSSSIVPTEKGLAMLNPYQYLERDFST
jgi:hypothetical protein